MGSSRRLDLERLLNWWDRKMSFILWASLLLIRLFQNAEMPSAIKPIAQWVRRSFWVQHSRCDSLGTKIILSFRESEKNSHETVSIVTAITILLTQLTLEELISWVDSEVYSLAFILPLSGMNQHHCIVLQIRLFLWHPKSRVDCFEDPSPNFACSNSPILSSSDLNLKAFDSIGFVLIQFRDFLLERQCFALLENHELNQEIVLAFVVSLFGSKDLLGVSMRRTIIEYRFQNDRNLHIQSSHDFDSCRSPQ